MAEGLSLNVPSKPIDGAGQQGQANKVIADQVKNLGSVLVQTHNEMERSKAEVHVTQKRSEAALFEDEFRRNNANKLPPDKYQAQITEGIARIMSDVPEEASDMFNKFYENRAKMDVDLAVSNSMIKYNGIQRELYKKGQQVLRKESINEVSRNPIGYSAIAAQNDLNISSSLFSATEHQLMMQSDRRDMAEEYMMTSIRSGDLKVMKERLKLMEDKSERAIKRLSEEDNSYYETLKFKLSRAIKETEGSKKSVKAKETAKYINRMESLDDFDTSEQARLQINRRVLKAQADTGDPQAQIDHKRYEDALNVYRIGKSMIFEDPSAISRLSVNMEEQVQASLKKFNLKDTPSNRLVLQKAVLAFRKKGNEDPKAMIDSMYSGNKKVKANKPTVELMDTMRKYGFKPYPINNREAQHIRGIFKLFGNDRNKAAQLVDAMLNQHRDSGGKKLEALGIDLNGRLKDESEVITKGLLQKLIDSSSGEEKEEYAVYKASIDADDQMRELIMDGTPEALKRNIAVLSAQDKDLNLQAVIDEFGDKVNSLVGPFIVQNPDNLWARNALYSRYALNRQTMNRWQAKSRTVAEWQRGLHDFDILGNTVSVFNKTFEFGYVENNINALTDFLENIQPFMEQGGVSPEINGWASGEGVKGEGIEGQTGLFFKRINSNFRPVIVDNILSFKAKLRGRPPLTYRNAKGDIGMVEIDLSNIRDPKNAFHKEIMKYIDMGADQREKEFDRQKRIFRAR
jgi:hypothetical protein